MKLVRLIKMCFNKTYSKVLNSKHLTDAFHTQDDMKQDVSSPMLFNFPSEYVVRTVQ